MIIKPYSDTTAQVMADFPACKVFFKCSDAAGSALLESVAGRSLAFSTGSFTTVSNGIHLAGGLAPAMTLATPIVVGSKKALLLSAYNISGANVQLQVTGASSGMGITTGGIFTAMAYEGTNVATPVAQFSSGAIYGGAVMLRPGASGQAQKYQCQIASGSQATEAARSSAVGAITALNSSIVTVNLGALGGTIDLYGLALFVFNSAEPADLITAIQWMTAAWQAGDKRIYPGWKGLA